MKHTFDLEAFESEHGKVYGRDSEKARIYRHSGNWHYEPANFFAADPLKAAVTAMNIEADLNVWNEDENRWENVFENYVFYEHDEFSKELIEVGLNSIGTTREALGSGKCKEGYKSAYHER